MVITAPTDQAPTFSAAMNGAGALEPGSPWKAISWSAPLFRLRVVPARVPTSTTFAVVVV